MLTLSFGKGENGAIFPLLALLVIVFFSLLALAIDLTIASASIEETRQSARLVALAALEEYFDSKDPVTGEPAFDLNAALQRANDVSGLNNSAFAMGGKNVLEIGKTDEVSDSGKIYLIPGKWFFSKPLDTDPCGEDYPCFRDLESAETANAFRIKGSVYGGGARAIFSRIFGSANFLPITVSVTATVIPRHGCFLVDLSRSMTRETHLRNDPNDPNDTPAEYALNEGVSEHQSVWGQIQAKGNRDLSVTPIVTDHYQDDYIQVVPLADGDSAPTGTDTDKHPDPADNALYSAGSIAGTYKLDVFRGAPYAGPQPLTTIFEGLQTALEAFKKRAVAGDMACLIFYDESLSWPRVMKLTDDFDYLMRFTDHSGYDGDPASIDPIDGANLTEGLPLALKHGLFPTGEYSNTLLATSEAFRQFASPEGSQVPSADFIVSIGDGLTNCVSRCEGTDNPELWDTNNDGWVGIHDIFGSGVVTCLTAQNLLDAGDTSKGSTVDEICGNSVGDANGDGVANLEDGMYGWSEILRYFACMGYYGGCGISYPYHRESLTELKNFAQDTMFPAKIPFHAILVGDQVAPHTVDIESASNPGTCATDEEARKEELPFVNGGSIYGDNGYQLKDQYQNMSPQTPYYYVNQKMYEIARLTGGIWGPIRPPKAGCIESTTPLCEIGSVRQLNDPYCRSKTDQMKDYMEEIMGQNPYTIVESS